MTHEEVSEALDDIMERLAELYAAYYAQDSNVYHHRTEIENALITLLVAYGAYLN